MSTLVAEGRLSWPSFGSFQRHCSFLLKQPSGIRRVAQRHFSCAPPTGSCLNEDERNVCLKLFGLGDGPWELGELKARYLELAKSCHPDAVGSESKSDAVEEFRRLRACYESLVRENDAARQVPDWLKELRESYANSRDPFP
eukprot:TRINITY_DN4832_c0_g1_i1.p1 TRINITY_DN4832_c0_g1~~TRINITY_DN4832_c0_g1_i1.p1  ORF type:complete len:142 (-),score=8.99 TRINITY_DN4832_c0_g1_i1:257-682(-)